MAVSGGMDSLLALCLLKERGLSAGAVHAQFLDPTAQSAAMLQRLRTTCRIMGAPLHILDLREPFQELVVRPFARAYAACATPNPCIFCNARIKFGLLRAASQKLGYSHFATGHYARFTQGLSSKPETDGSSQTLLFPALDNAKNQIYFLSLVPRACFENVLFPLGGIRKKDIPDMLARRGIPLPESGESQEICFIPDNDYRAFLKQMNAPLTGPGPILLPDGTQVGTHAGLWNYTEGQRKGLGVAWSEPLYVLRKEKKENVLRVGPKKLLGARGCCATQIHIHLPPDAWPETLFVQTRYRQKPLPAAVTLEHDRFFVFFEETGDIPAQGQTAVIFGPSGHILAAGVIDHILYE